VSCSPGNVCCNTQPIPVTSKPVQQPVQQPTQQIPFQDLPQTECPRRMECVMDQFCDKSGTISPVRIQLSKQEKTLRGELIPCINTQTSRFDVCCTRKQDTSFSTVGQLQINNTPSFQQSSCPQINSFPPTSSCAGKTSACFNVGKRDADCGGGVCCFDGCANLCMNTQKEKLKQKPSKKAKEPTKIKETKQQIIQEIALAKFPKVQCPSAMRCVPKSNCNFSGVISRQTITLTQLQEEWRVPLSTCVNLNQRKTEHVCCRE